MPDRLSTIADTSSHLARKLQRDLQFVDEGPSYIEQQTCSNIVTHPDPCPHCWPGRKAKPSEPLLATLSQRAESVTGHECQTGDQEPCRRCHYSRCKHKHHCQGGRLDLLFEDFQQPSRLSNQNQSISRRERCGESSDDNAFGPWSDRPAGNDKLNKDTSDEIWSNIFNQSSTAYVPTRSESVPLSIKQGKTSLLSDRRDFTVRHPLDRPQSGIDSSRRSSIVGRNSWSYRESDNLRFPCISNVIGTLDKSEAHSR